MSAKNRGAGPFLRSLEATNVRYEFEIANEGYLRPVDASLDSPVRFITARLGQTAVFMAGA